MLEHIVLVFGVLLKVLVQLDGGLLLNLGVFHLEALPDLNDLDVVYVLHN